MKISMATANFFSIPFNKTLDIIKKAGFEYIELSGYWCGGDNWEAAQHLKGLQPKDVIKMIEDHGLKIASYHDMGGVIESNSPSLIHKSTYEYLEHYDFPCIVFHTPHKKTNDKTWWKCYEKTAINDLKSINKNRIISIENMPYFNGFMVPLIAPNEMLEFIQANNLYANIDTTHFAQCNIDISEAAKILKDRTKTIHISDYINGKSHIYMGDGTLDFNKFYRSLDISNLHATTIECDIASTTLDEQVLIEKCKYTKYYIETILQNLKS